MKYILKGRLINLTIDYVAMAIDLLDDNDIKNNWSLRFLFPNKKILILIYYITAKFYSKCYDNRFSVEFHLHG